MFAELQELRKAAAEFEAIKPIIAAAKAAPVTDYITDGSQKTAFQATLDMLKFAGEHHVTVLNALKELEDPATAKSEIERLLQQAKDHSTELGKFIEEAKALGGAEFKVITGAIAAYEAAKAGK